MPESLNELSDRATPGPWSVESMDNEGNSPSDKFTSYCIEANGKALADTLNSLTICLEEEHDEDWSRTWDEQGRRDTAFIVALVNAYRAGRLYDDTALATAVARARREALEEAAEVVEREAGQHNTDTATIFRIQGAYFRRRALAATQPEARQAETGRVLSARLIPWEPGSHGGVALVFSDGLQCAIALDPPAIGNLEGEGRS